MRKETTTESIMGQGLSAGEGLVNGPLQKEALRLARHLFGVRHLPARLQERYGEACRLKISPALSGQDRKLLKWWHRFPILFSLLEAGACLKSRENILSQKALILFAVVETDPEFFSFFEEKPAARPVLLGRLLKEGVGAFLKMGIGFVLVRVLR